jgi:hypothetical protein
MREIVIELRLADILKAAGKITACCIRSKKVYFILAFRMNLQENCFGKGKF